MAAAWQLPSRRTPAVSELRNFGTKNPVQQKQRLLSGADWTPGPGRVSAGAEGRWI